MVPSNVISAIAEGKRAAVSIDKFISGENAFLEYDSTPTMVDKEKGFKRKGNSPRGRRTEIQLISPSERKKNFNEYTDTYRGGSPQRGQKVS